MFNSEALDLKGKRRKLPKILEQLVIVYVFILMGGGNIGVMFDFLWNTPEHI